MEPWGIPVSTGYSCKDLASRATQKHLLLRKVEIRPNDWPEILQDSTLFVKKNSMPNHIKSLGYFSCYSLASSIPIKSPGNSARCNYQSFFSLLGRPETILEVGKKATFLQVIDQKAYYLQVFQRLY